MRKFDSFTVNFKSKMVMPKKTEEITIYFHPLEVGKYHNLIPFFVNSKIYTISVYGEGVPLLLNVVNPDDRFVDMSNTMIGKVAIKSVKVFNNGVVSLDVKFDIWNRLPHFHRIAKTLQPDFDVEEQPPIIQEKIVAQGAKGKKKGGKEDKTKKKRSKAKTKSSKSAKSSKSSKSKKSKSSASSKNGKKTKEPEIKPE